MTQTSQSQSTSSTLSLTIDDILADLTLLTHNNPSTNNQPHPLLSLGRSLVPTDCLSPSESAVAAASASSALARDHNQEPDLHLLEDETGRLQRLLRSLDQREGDPTVDINTHLEVVRLFLKFSNSTLASLSGKVDGGTGAATSQNGTASNMLAGQQIESLHARVAEIQAELDQRERQLQAARDMLE